MELSRMSLEERRRGRRERGVKRLKDHRKLQTRPRKRNPNTQTLELDGLTDSSDFFFSITTLPKDILSGLRSEKRKSEETTKANQGRKDRKKN
jgi:hypothetical protein